MADQALQQEKLPQNRSLLNRRCKLALASLKEVPDPKYLYSLQLASLALERGLYPSRGPELQLTVDGMLSWSPENAQKFLEENAQGEPNELAPKPRQSPEQLAASILGEVEHKLSLPSASNYPSMPRKGSM